MRFSELKKKLGALGKLDLLKDISDPLDLPLLFIYGRSDMSIEYYGAKVTPDNLREILFGIETLAPALNTFRLLSYEDEAHNKRMEVAIELVKGANLPSDVAALAETIFKKLGAMNGDFYNAMFKTATSDNLPQVTVHEFEAGPFSGGQKRLKNEYVSSGLVYDKL